MSALGSWAAESDPSSLFLALWSDAAPWSPVRRLDAKLLDYSDIELLAQILLGQETGGDAAKLFVEKLRLISKAGSFVSGSKESDGLIISAMMAIDEVFAQIHPRNAWIGSVPRPSLPRWLCELQDERTRSGEYIRRAERRLIARGPLRRPARTVVDVNADTLEDRFSALTAAPLVAQNGEQALEIAVRTVGTTGARGVLARKPGRETIGFVAVAELDIDLEYKWRSADGREYLDVKARKDLDAGQRLLEAVKSLGKLDVLVAPELTVSAEHAAQYAAALDLDTAPKLTIAGSGPSGHEDELGRRFNASTAFNSVGAELWTHRKVWPYGMGKAQVEKCKLGDLPEGTLLMEEMQAGEALTVADLDGFGRVVTLVCQDFQISPGVSEILRIYQPDWVFVPVLDTGVGPTRWVHSTAFGLAGLSRARFVVSCSLSLAQRSNAPDYPQTPIALFVGPRALSAKEAAEGQMSRAFAAAACTFDAPMCGKLTWGVGSGVWKQTSLKAL